MVIAAKHAFRLSCLLCLLLLTGCVSQVSTLVRVAALDGNTFSRNGRIYHLGLYGTEITDEQLASLVQARALRDLRELNLGKTEVSDEGLACLQELPNLEVLWLQFTSVGDEGMQHVAKLQNLRSLELRDTLVTDRGVVCLTKLPKLDLLNLSGTKVTDAVAVPLRGMSNLRTIGLSGTAVTKAGMAEIRRNLSHCKVWTLSDDEQIKLIMETLKANEEKKKQTPTD